MKPLLLCSLIAASLLPCDYAIAQGDLYRITEGSSRTVTNFHPVAIPRGGEHVLADLKGPGKITYFYITDDTAGRWYPGLVLKVYWDDAKEPSIQLPLSDFFGAIGGKSVDYMSLPMQINHACFMCYLPMPHSTRARFVLSNDGDRDYAQKVAYGIDREEGASYAKEKAAFTANGDAAIPSRMACM